MIILLLLLFYITLLVSIFAIILFLTFLSAGLLDVHVVAFVRPFFNMISTINMRMDPIAS